MSIEKSLTSAAHKLAGVAAVYSALRRLMGNDRYRQHFVERAIGGYALGRILDLGCGTGQMATFLPHAERYVGIDKNKEYIRYAKVTAPPNAEFLHGDITNIDFKKLGQFECVIAMGVLHHLSDQSVEAMLSNATPALLESGRMATTDCVRRPENHWSADFMINHDRGHYVRDAIGYEKLLSDHFHDVRGQEMIDGLRVPLTGAVFPQYMTISEGVIE